MNINENKWIENHTERPMINETLFNTENYPELRTKMVDELMEDQMGMPTTSLVSMLEEFLWDMFHNMDDDQLQDMFDTLKEDKNE
jgi:3-hydroxyacyl-CoA dehydrogenase